jgi:hypothetical protein
MTATWPSKRIVFMFYSVSLFLLFVEKNIPPLLSCESKLREMTVKKVLLGGNAIKIILVLIKYIILRFSKSALLHFRFNYGFFTV